MSQNRRYTSHVRQAQMQRYALYGLAALALLVLLILVIRAMTSNTPKDEVLAGSGLQVTQSAPPLQTGESEQPASPEPTKKVKASASTVKKLPVIYRKKDEKKRIAITIDDCFDADIMRAICKLAKANGADLTFFPKGATIEKNADLWKQIYEAGYEIENHSFPHSNVTDLNDEQLRAAIVDSEKALNKALGVNYHMRMFRCPTGDGMNDPRLHKILRELGYQAVASWGLSGTRKAEETIKLTQPGQLLLFHATKTDYDRLKVVIPALVDKGYELVNVNTLYGKGTNEVTPLDTYDH